MSVIIYYIARIFSPCLSRMRNTLDWLSLHSFLQGVSRLWDRNSASSHATRRHKLFIALFVVIFVPAFFIMKRSNFDPVGPSGYDDMVLLKNTPSTGISMASSTVPPKPMPSEHTSALDSSDWEPVVFAFIMYSEDSASEGAALIKSVLMYNSRPSHFHVICDEPARHYLEERISLLSEPVNDVRIYYYDLSMASMRARIEREGSIFTDHSAGGPGLMKLFIHEILPDHVQKAIYVDTDALFISDPLLLWQVFDSWNATTAFSMPTHPDQSAPEWHDASKICSCIMLLHLERLRALRMMDSSLYRSDTSGIYPPALSPPAFDAMYGPLSKGGRYENVRLGDQGYYWAIVKHRSDVFKPLDLDWEISSCLQDMYLTGLGDDTISQADELSRLVHNQGSLILPKLLHFNCLHGTPRYNEWPGWSDPTDGLNQRWGAAVKYHFGYKWIWLNKGTKDKKGEVISHIVSDWMFADERFAAAQS